MVNEIEKNKNNNKFYKAIEKLNYKKHNKFYLYDDDGKLFINDNQLVIMTTEYYKKLFSDQNILRKNKNESPWIGEANKLKNPITTIEVNMSIQKLKNGKAPGKDGIFTDFIKYAGNDFYENLSMQYNKIFEYHKSINSLTETLIIPINKPNKPKLVENTRPIQLLSVLRKILSRILLMRLQDKILQYVNISQRGFKPHSSTTDIIWTYRWLFSVMEKFKVDFSIIGIDFSRAYDCINIKLLLHIFENVIKIELDELRILKYLITGVTAYIKINKTIGGGFGFNTGIPQGDSLSPCLWIVYLQYILNDYYEKKSFKWNFHNEYADDVDWIRIHNKSDLNKNNDGIKKIFNEELEEINTNLFSSFSMGNLKLNLNKTENYFLSNPKNKNNSYVKKLGTIINVQADITNRINLCSIAFKNLYKCWTNNKYIKLKSKLKIYNIYIKSILLYNACCLTAPKVIINKMNTIHRKHLRIMMEIFYPNIITNDELYKQTNTISITDEIFIMRWKYLGNILREKNNHICFNIMQNYFENESKNKKFKGRKITLAKQLSMDMQLINLTLNNLNDFKTLTLKANDKKTWKNFMDELYQKYVEQQLFKQQTVLLKRKNCYKNDNNNNNTNNTNINIENDNDNNKKNNSNDNDNNNEIMNEIINTQLKKRKLDKNDITNKYLNNNTNLFVHKEKNNNNNNINNNNNNNKNKRKRNYLTVEEQNENKIMKQNDSKKRKWSIERRIKFEEAKKLKKSDFDSKRLFDMLF
jgi:hypothetical protein